MLEIRNLIVAYGGAPALHGLSLEVKEGEIVSVVGSNGAGKTTLLKTISGLLHPIQGDITFFGERINKEPPWKIVKRGIALIPEGRGIFPYMTVLESLRLGAYIYKKPDQASIDFAFNLFPILKERSNQQAGTLSGGERQMLAIARGLMSKPKLLMLDEPSLGLSPTVVLRIFEIVNLLKKQGVTVLLVEQNVRHSLEVADRAYVLETGKIVLDGTGKALLNNEQVKKAYLGT